MKYNWQQKDWPDFRYDLTDLENILIDFISASSHVSGVLEGMSEDVKSETIIDLMVTEAVKTSAIEGEYISRKDVISSLRNQLGLNIKSEKVVDRKAKGAAELMMAVRNDFNKPLSQEMLLSWHKLLMQGTKNIQTGAWRTHEDPMQVVSNLHSIPKVHFEAPPSRVVPKEMKNFIDWFNKTISSIKNDVKMIPVQSAIAHLYFETIHPFEDGNGRIGRALSEKAIFQSSGRPIAISLSKTIEADKRAYYDALENAQKSNEITNWIHYFVHMLMAAQKDIQILIDFILKKTRFLDEHKEKLNDRHLKALLRMFKEGPNGFEGGMTAKKYITLTNASKATATRDLQYLVEIGALQPAGAGRSVRYDLKL